PHAEAKNIEPRFDLPASQPVVETDEQKLRQVLSNLTGNAIKCTRHGSVTLRLAPAAQSEGGAILQVIDTGIGMPQDKQQTIFEAFRQADSSTTREFGGTGLGLTISRSLVQLLGGTLNVASEDGKGSIFSIKLPARPAGPFPLAPQPAAVQNGFDSSVAPLPPAP